MNVDFEDLVAPTVAVSNVRLLAALACELNLDLCHSDIKQASVQPSLEEVLQMRLPQGCGRLSEKIVRPNKSLHGLKQASGQWHAHLNIISNDICLASFFPFYRVFGNLDLPTQQKTCQNLFLIFEFRFVVKFLESEICHFICRFRPMTPTQGCTNLTTPRRPMLELLYLL